MNAPSLGQKRVFPMCSAARSLAALEGSAEVTISHLRRVALPALRHRLRRNPLDDSSSTSRVERAVVETWGDEPNQS